MFISMVAPGYTYLDETALTVPVEGWVELTEMVCSGHRMMLEIGDVWCRRTGFRWRPATTTMAPRPRRGCSATIRQLGYRGSVVHYVGMSHYFRLAPVATSFLVGGAGDPLCTPARAWHLAFFAECKRTGFSPILSLSYEVLAQHCPDAWQQRAYNGDPSRTGWDPPSALLSPANAVAMAWLRSAGVGIHRTDAAGGGAGAVSGRRAVVVDLRRRRTHLHLRRRGQAGFRRQSCRNSGPALPLNAAQTALLDAGRRLARRYNRSSGAGGARRCRPRSGRSTAAGVPADACSIRRRPRRGGPICRSPGHRRPSTGCRSRTTTG